MFVLNLSALFNVPCFLSWEGQWLTNPYPLQRYRCFSGFCCVPTSHQKITSLLLWIHNQESRILQIQKCAQKWCVDSISHVSSQQNELWQIQRKTTLVKTSLWHFAEVVLNASHSVLCNVCVFSRDRRESNLYRDPSINNKKAIIQLEYLASVLDADDKLWTAVLQYQKYNQAVWWRWLRGSRLQKVGQPRICTGDCSLLCIRRDAKENLHFTGTLNLGVASLDPLKGHQTYEAVTLI